jgi:hypothetical protein
VYRRYLHKMTGLRTIAGMLVAFGMTTAGSALARSPAKAPQPSELWATVDICNTSHHPDTIGIRGSMPGDGHAGDTLYMRFLVQSQNATTKQWADIGKSGDSGFVSIGSATVARQAGRTFEFKASPTSYTLRGEVEFQWRRGHRVLRHASLPTSAGHASLAGAEPKGYSAATCVLP